MKKLLASLLVLVLVVYACQKENSFENGNVESDGLLQSDVSGDCFPKTVAGTYVQGTALDGNANFITVSVMVNTPGAYIIGTDTVNGVFFRASGLFTASGMSTVNLRGNGTPATQGTFNFRVQYDSQECVVPVVFLPTGAGGPAVFTLNGAGGNCTGANVAGSYAVGVALNATNTVTINVNVSTIGTYNVSTTATNGMTFTGSGTFATTGAQTIVLTGSGTPTAANSTIIPITVGANSCNFTIPVGSASVGTLGGGPNACTPFTINGTYTAGSALVAATHTVGIQATVTTPGVYSISSNTVNGISFAASGSFAANGTQPVTLVGTGTPTAAGTFNYTVTYGTSSCTFSVTVVGAAVSDYFPRTTNSNWSYDIDNVFDDSILSKVIAPTHSALGNTYNIFMATFDPATTDTFGYFRRNGGDYYRFTNLADYIYFDNDYFAEFIFLKDNVAANTTWNSPSFTGAIGGSPFTIRIVYKILQKDVSVTVKGVPYPNTIVVEEKYEANIGGIWTNMDALFGYYRDYYSRNVGWIQDEYYDGTSSTPAGVLGMRRYAVY